MAKTLIQEIASTLLAVENCKQSGNVTWQDRHTAWLVKLAERLPHGSGIDCGTKIAAVSTPERVVLTLSFHHMDESGMYDGWTEHSVIVTPSLVFGFDLRVTGKDRNGIKEYLHGAYNASLSGV
jgi:hypothetical protein